MLTLDATPTSTRASALPVQLSVSGARLEPLRRLVEGPLGWQPVDEATAELVPPSVQLADVGAARRPGTPVVLLVGDDDVPAAVAEAAVRLRPVAAVAWPPSEDALQRAAAEAAAAVAPVRVGATLRFGGAGGGVGTSTIAAAVAGLAAWRGTPTLLVTLEPTSVPAGTPTLTPSALAAGDLWARATELPGAGGCRVVRTTEAAHLDAPRDARIGLAVVDVGVADEVDVLVVGADARALAALDRTTAAAVVVVGTGPVPTTALREAAGRRRFLALPRSARVARAAALGRVPGALPGRFVTALAPLLPADPGG